MPRFPDVTLSLGYLLQGFQRNDVLGVEFQNPLKRAHRIVIRFFVEIASPQDDMSAGVVWPVLDAFLDILDGQVDFALLPVSVSECRKPLFRVLGVPLLELLDLRPICHGFSSVE